jgi:hypothetical protein
MHHNLIVIFPERSGISATYEKTLIGIFTDRRWGKDVAAISPY